MESAKPGIVELVQELIEGSGTERTSAETTSGSSSPVVEDNVSAAVARTRILDGVGLTVAAMGEQMREFARSSFSWGPWLAGVHDGDFADVVVYPRVR